MEPTFPSVPTMVSLVVELRDGRSVEVASIGREGAVGGIVSCGHAPAFARRQGDGPRAGASRADDGAGGSEERSGFIAQHVLPLLGLSARRKSCSPSPATPSTPIQQRAARWLLTAQDRAGDRIELTQEALAGLLGVQRTTVNAVVGALAGPRPDLGSARAGDRGRPRRAQAACLRMLRRSSSSISAR